MLFRILTGSCLSWTSGTCFRTKTGELRQLRTMASLVDKKLKLSDGINTISYIETQEAMSGIPTLLLPGALGTARSDFGPQLEGMKGKLHLIAWDPPGYGGSRPPARTWPEAPTFYHQDARIAHQFMTELGHNKYAVVGWSDGAITSLIMAALFPKEIDQMVCFAGNAYYTQKEADFITSLKDVSKWSERMRKPYEDIYGVDYFPVLWGEFANAVESIFKNHKGNICKELLPDIQCPSLIIHGAKDALVASEHPDYLKENIKNSRMEIFPDGKHNLHFKYSAEFNKLVVDFLTSS